MSTEFERDSNANQYYMLNRIHVIECDSDISESIIDAIKHHIGSDDPEIDYSRGIMYDFNNAIHQIDVWMFIEALKFKKDELENENKECGEEWDIEYYDEIIGKLEKYQDYTLYRIWEDT